MNTPAVDLGDYVSSPAVRHRGGRVALGLPLLHLESLDESAVPWCRDWRAEILMWDVAAAAEAGLVVVGAVDFVLVQLSETKPDRPVADYLAMLGVRAARFGELFAGGRLEPGLDEHIDFCDGMPMYSALLVLSADVDDLLPPSRLRAWAVAEVIATMLSTSAGIVAAPDETGSRHRRLVGADRLDRDWLHVGLTGIPGHPGLQGRATLFTYLDDARALLSDVAEQVVTVDIGG